MSMRVEPVSPSPSPSAPTIDARNADLSGSRFDNVNLSGSDYRNINLSGSSFEDISSSFDAWSSSLPVSSCSIAAGR